MASELKQELAVLNRGRIIIQIQPPSRFGKLNGESAEERAAEAQHRAQSIHAHIVIHGMLIPGPTSTRFVPEFYLANHALRNAEELVGDHQLGAALEARNDQLLKSDLRSELLKRTRTMANVAIGVWYYQRDNFREAERYFRDAVRIQGLDDHEGKEVLYLFLGNAAGKQRRYGEAGRHYQQALAIDSQYARARYGIAETLFLQTRPACRPNHTDGPALNQAIAQFMRARAATNQPALSDIGTKIAFGLGRTYVCLTLAGIAERSMEANRELPTVILAFENGNTRIGTLASEAYGQLGLLAFAAKGSDHEIVERYRCGVEFYRQAIRLSERPERRQAFYDLLGSLYDRLGRPAEATMARQEALKPNPMPTPPPSTAAGAIQACSRNWSP